MDEIFVVAAEGLMTCTVHHWQNYCRPATVSGKRARYIPIFPLLIFIKPLPRTEWLDFSQHAERPTLKPSEIHCSLRRAEKSGGNLTGSTGSAKLDLVAK